MSIMCSGSVRMMSCRSQTQSGGTPCRGARSHHYPGLSPSLPADCAPRKRHTIPTVEGPCCRRTDEALVLYPTPPQGDIDSSQRPPIPSVGFTPAASPCAGTSPRLQPIRVTATRSRPPCAGAGFARAQPKRCFLCAHRARELRLPHGWPSPSGWPQTGRVRAASVHRRAD